MKKVYLGAGQDHKDGYINLDICPFNGIDVVCDVTKGLPFEDSTIDYIYSQDFLEHLPSEAKIPLMNEVWRVLKNEGRMEHIVPLAGTRNDYGSPSHLSHWHPQQFEHFDVDSYRYKVDHVYEGFVGGFKKILTEYAQELNDEPSQSFRVIYEAIK